MSFQQFTGTRRYIADEALMASVNAAVALQRPLLVKGEPGTGKTLLATAIADGLGKPLMTWHIKSTTKAIDGLYHYDVVQRLNDSRFGDTGHRASGDTGHRASGDTGHRASGDTGHRASGARDVSDVKSYIKLGVLGRAFTAEQQVVLLIDEVDKADIEFPNDLLRELDEMKFHIPEIDETIAAKQRPIVVITSNAEKELPDAFLRRCVFHFIAFPDRERMERIVKVHHPHLDQSLLDAAITRFFAFRKTAGLRKPPSTSELVDWLTVLVRAGVSPDDVVRSDPFLGVLFKQEQDVAAASRKRGVG